MRGSDKIKFLAIDGGLMWESVGTFGVGVTTAYDHLIQGCSLHIHFNTIYMAPSRFHLFVCSNNVAWLQQPLNIFYIVIKVWYSE